MREFIENGLYNTRLYPSDWRYSAAIIGLIKYFDYNEISYHKDVNYIEYNKEDLDREKYLNFAKDFYQEDFHHIKLLNSLNKEEYSDEDISNINKLIKSSPSYLKSIIGKFVFDGKNSFPTIAVLPIVAPAITNNTSFSSN